MKRMLSLGLIGATLAAAVPALAQPAPERGPGRMQARIFQQADANRDGRVTEEEAMTFLAARFAEADTASDGALTPEELGGFLRSRWEAMRPGPAAGRERRDPPPPMQRAMAERQSRMFRMADINRDGRVTLEEARPLAAMFFRAADRNGDGALELAELRGPGRMGPRQGGRHSDRQGGRGAQTAPTPPAAEPVAPPAR